MLRRTRDVAAVAAASSVLGPPAAALSEVPTAAQAQPDPRDGRGYHETEHTRRYYELARF